MRSGRWRTWLRTHTPTALYDRGIVVPKIRDCDRHEWYRQDEETEACYHCRASRVRPGRADER